MYISNDEGRKDLCLYPCFKVMSKETCREIGIEVEDCAGMFFRALLSLRLNSYCIVLNMIVCVQKKNLLSRLFLEIKSSSMRSGARKMNTIDLLEEKCMKNGTQGIIST